MNHISEATATEPDLDRSGDTSTSIPPQLHPALEKAIQDAEQVPQLRIEACVLSARAGMRLATASMPTNTNVLQALGRLRRFFGGIYHVAAILGVPAGTVEAWYGERYRRMDAASIRYVMLVTRLFRLDQPMRRRKPRRLMQQSAA